MTFFRDLAPASANGRRDTCCNVVGTSVSFWRATASQDLRSSLFEQQDIDARGNEITAHAMIATSVIGIGGQHADAFADHLNGPYGIVDGSLNFRMTGIAGMTESGGEVIRADE